jgi:hypothetical protein
MERLSARVQVTKLQAAAENVPGAAMLTTIKLEWLSPVIFSDVRMCVLSNWLARK